MHYESREGLNNMYHAIITTLYSVSLANQNCYCRGCKANTPSVNGLSGSLLTDNPNGINPFRIPRSNATTCDNDHLYTRLQEAYNGGLMDKFVKTNIVGKGCNPSITIGYFDGNTVTGLWNYAQHFSMNDNFFGTTFGSSTPGAINLIYGQTHGATPQNLNITYHE